MSRAARSAWVPWAILAVLCGAALALVDGFGRIELTSAGAHGPLIDVLRRSAPLALVALGMACVIASGGVDLSVGASMALSASIAAECARTLELPHGVALGLALAAGLGVGLFNALLVAYLRLAPILATLVSYSIARGLAQLVSGAGIAAFDAEAWTRLARGSWCFVPNAFWLVVLTSAGLVLLVRRTSLGLHLEASGGNARAASLAGIGLGRTWAFAYTLCAMLSALAGLLVSADAGAADAGRIGVYFELDAILAVVLGGGVLGGGRLRVLGAVCGALIHQTLTTLLLGVGTGSAATLCIKAALVLLVLALQSGALRAQLARLRVRSAPLT